MAALIPLALFGVLAALGIGAVVVMRGSRSTPETAVVETKREPYGLWSRLVLFLIVFAVVVLIFGWVFVQLGIGMAMTAGGGSGTGMAGVVLLACPILLIVAGYFIFKR